MVTKAKQKNKNKQHHQQNNKSAQAPLVENSAGDSPSRVPENVTDINTPATAVAAISIVHSQALESATEDDIETATKVVPPSTDVVDISALGGFA